MAEAINADAKTETINEESVAPLQPMLSQNKTQFAPDKFFASLNQLGKTLDSEVSHLETVVGRQVSRALSSRQDGEFAAPIADDMHDELQDLNRFV